MEKTSVIINSHSIRLLLRNYHSYVCDRIQNCEPIAPLELFYKANKGKDLFKTSRTYEQYLAALSRKSLTQPLKKSQETLQEDIDALNEEEIDHQLELLEAINNSR